MAIVHNAPSTLLANLLNTMAGTSFTVGVAAPDGGGILGRWLSHPSVFRGGGGHYMASGGGRITRDRASGAAVAFGGAAAWLGRRYVR